MSLPSSSPTHINTRTSSFSMVEYTSPLLPGLSEKCFFMALHAISIESSFPAKISDTSQFNVADV